MEKDDANKRSHLGFTAENEKFLGIFPSSVRDILGPGLLVAITPVAVIVLWLLICDLKGDVGQLWNMKTGRIQYVYEHWPSYRDPDAWRLIGLFAVFQLFLMRVVPGRVFEASPTATGHVPVYKANGMACYIITLLTYLGLVKYAGWDSGEVHDRMGNIISGLSVGSLVFCLFLYFKGLYAPSTADSGTNGVGFMKDYFWGTELYPRIWGWDVKQFTNCRFGMMFWAMGLLCFAHKQANINGGRITNSMIISVMLQLVYITKFFMWEMGYMCSMDIQHDRAGYYICWGCLVFVPSFYTSAGMYLAEHPRDLPIWQAIAITVAGFICIWSNYDADRMRQHFRKQGGKCMIWGKPAKCIVAKYDNGKGGTSQSLLLVSGWWGMARHFHYIAEILGALCWSLPAGFASPVPYFYVIFLTILLVDRSYRDDIRCRGKYGAYWTLYCDAVPYKIVPGIL